MIIDKDVEQSVKDVMDAIKAKYDVSDTYEEDYGTDIDDCGCGAKKFNPKVACKHMLLQQELMAVLDGYLDELTIKEEVIMENTGVSNEDLKQLAKEVEYKWKPGKGGGELAYIDARQVMDLLDEVCGPANWQRKTHEVGEKVYCSIGIFTGGQWVWKDDVGTESNWEADKGQASDAFKRAAVNWGIGRFLYNIKGGKPKTTSSYSSPQRTGGYTPSGDSGASTQSPDAKASEGQVKRLFAIGINECGYSAEAIGEGMKRKGLSKESLTVGQIDDMIKAMQDNKRKK